MVQACFTLAFRCQTIIMRLIRTTSEEPELVSFSEEEIPDYAILSHVWEEEEVSFQHMQDPSSINLKNKKGWSKIVQACKVARSERWSYIWIDTCCIDKSSSAELSEAINSMYRYYSKAGVCYVYLADLRSDLTGRSFSLAFCTCKWFTRGWTLQELIAPKTVVFFAKDWERFGTKASLQGFLTEITRIPSDVLLSRADPSNSSIAARMSWAAGRRTTRIEDRAYSLMGLFGEHAFIRLQEEILKVSNDHTIFAWKAPEPSIDYSGILATSPDVFEGSGEYEPLRPDSQRPFSMTNMGLLVHLPLLLAPVKRELLAVLNCTSKKSKQVAIYVTKSHHHQHQYERARSDRLVEDDDLQAKCGKIQQLLFKAWDLPSFHRFGDNFIYNSISVSLSGDQGIVPVMSGSNSRDGHLPLAVEEITDTGDLSLGAWELRDVNEFHSFLFIHNPSQQPFVVMVGKNFGGFWLDLVLDLKTDKLNLKDIRQSYRFGKDMPGKNLDRISKFLTDNVAILVEGRRHGRSKSGDYLYNINIRIVKKTYSDIALAVLPITCRCVFSVSISSAIKAGFSRLETYPDNVWEECDSDTMNLFLDDANTLGTLCFQHEQNRKIFAVTLRFNLDSTVQSGVLSLMDTEDKETAKDICKSYNNNQKRSQGLTRYPYDSTTYISNTLKGSQLDRTSVSLHVIRKSHSSRYNLRHNQYSAEIKVKPQPVW
ncbi:heterokaryon incompatibility protein-domain-containing protein [Rhodocollybia butyracea]|uniref:Heterokaryon incompatibility protein-domain-containing protein n=1 Tax=Rhodocollybia butyracea TaxID=206335 RepID=A0A9P5P3S6_9AGAR|nr:heterokaryon incompatibility protein-domain-containing protein [Rhodocollybia butyracea]